MNPPNTETKMKAPVKGPAKEDAAKAEPKLVRMNVLRPLRMADGNTVHSGEIKVSEDEAKNFEQKFEGPVDSNGNKTFIQRATRL